MLTKFLKKFVPEDVANEFQYEMSMDMSRNSFI